jgi:uncharacterized protein
MAQSTSIPMRQFGRHDVKISALGFGGHHLGDAEDANTAVRMLHEAVDGGITFFDNCWEYHSGKTEVWMGMGLKSLRDRVFLMTTVCTHGRDKDLAMRMLEESLHRLQTEVKYASSASRGPRTRRSISRCWPTGFPFDSVQMPLNSCDAGFHSFELKVLPEPNRRGIAVLGMMPLNGQRDAIKAGAITAEEALRYAMSLPVTTTITGIDKPEILQQNLQIAQNFQPMTPAEMQALRDRVRIYAANGRFELYKVSLKYDNPEARLAHDFPLDMNQPGVKDMLQATGTLPARVSARGGPARLTAVSRSNSDGRADLF